LAISTVSGTTVYWSVVPEAVGVAAEVDAIDGAGVDGGVVDGADAAGVVAAGGGLAGGDVTPGMGVTSLLVMLHGFDGVPFGKILFRILSMWFVERQQTVRRSTT